jgi:uncharacterized protein YegP (UPF0339 family)
MMVVSENNLGRRLEETRVAKFQIYKRTDGEYGWRLKSANGQTIAIAGEGFKAKAGAENGIAAVKKDASSATTEDLT